MGHLQVFRAAVGGKRPGNKAGLTTGTILGLGRLILAIGTLLVASVSGSASYAQTGTFNSMDGNRTGGSTVVAPGKPEISYAGTKAVTSISTFARSSTSPAM